MPLYAPTTRVSPALFLDATRTPFNPTTVTCTVTPPQTGTPPIAIPVVHTFGVDPAMANTGTGIFTCTYELAYAGVWLESWYGADANGDVTKKRQLEVF